MSLPRFYLFPLPAFGQADLTADDARHAQSVLRLKVGAEVVLFDGQGLEAAAAIIGLSRGVVTVDILRTESVSRELNCPLELVVALPKGDRQKLLVDMLVQLGVDQLTPLECNRSVAQPTSNTIDRLRRAAIETNKQCGRNQLMKINQPTSIAKLLEQLPPTESAVATPSLRLFSHPYGACGSLASYLESVHSSLRPAQIAIGPEGGFTDVECEQLRGAGWSQVGLGKRILRIETAAVMIAATWAALTDRP